MTCCVKFQKTLIFKRLVLLLFLLCYLYHFLITFLKPKMLHLLHTIERHTGGLRAKEYPRFPFNWDTICLNANFKKFVYGGFKYNEK